MAPKNDQAIYDTVVLAAHKNIFGDKNDDTRFKMVLQRLEGGKDDLATNIGGIAGVTLANIQGAAEKQQRDIPRQTIIEASDEIVDQLLDIAEAAKLLPGNRDAVKKKALFEALRVVGQQELKTMTPEKKAQAQAEMAQMKGKSKQGMKPGILASRMKEPA